MKNLHILRGFPPNMQHFGAIRAIRTYLLLGICCLLTSAVFGQTGMSSPVTVNANGIRLKALLDDLESQSGLTFVYNVDEVDGNREYAVKAQGEALASVLDRMLTPDGIVYKLVGKQVVLRSDNSRNSNRPGTDSPGQYQLKGQVMDTNDQPLPGASIIEKGTSNGTTTDFDGNFSILLEAPDGVLTVSYIGYTSQDVEVDGRSFIRVTMQEESAQLDEVVVTALGQEIKKEKLSYATQRVTTEESNVARGGDITRQLGGRIAGLNLISNGSSGGLVSSSRLTIRGENSLQLGKNEPLIVIDGVPISNNQDPTGGSFRPGFGDGDLPTDFGDGLTDLNPDDIASIDVLRGANAAALYGSRAANGVIVITTKSGKGRKMEIELNTGVTVSNIFNEWDIQETYGGGFNGNYDEFSGNNWGPAYDDNLLVVQSGSPEFPNPSPFIKRLEFDDFFQTGYTYNNNIAIQGSNSDYNYRFSYTDLRRTGTVPNTDYNRKNLSTKLGARLNDSFKIDFAGNYTQSFSDNMPVQGFNPQSVMYPLIWGHYNFDLDWFREYWRPGQEYVAQNWPFSWQNNIWLIANENLNSFKRNRVFGNVKLTYQPSPHWTVFVRAGTDYYDDRREAQRPSAQAQYPEGMYREQNFRFQETNLDFLATYNGKISEDFSITASLGANNLRQTSNQSRVEGRRLAIPGLYTLSNIENQLRPEQFESERVINSVYGQATLDWRNMVFLDVTGRNDWSSTLPLANNAYFYPSVGISALASRLFDLPETVNSWKLRANIAQVGNDTDPFIINPVKTLGEVPGSVQNQSFIPLTDLEPEITTSYEFGTELTAFNSRLFFEFNYYNNITENQIIQIPISEASGYSAQLINAGKIRNKGVELLLSGTPIQTKDFDWFVSLNWSRNVGTIEELTPGLDNFIISDTDVNGGNVQARVGGQIGDIYGFGYERSPDGDLVYRNGLAQRGNESIRLGNYNPDWIAGLSSSIRYKFLSASVLMDYRYGGELVSRTTGLLYRTGLAAETEFRPAGGIVGDGVVLNEAGEYVPNTTNVSLQDYWRALKGNESNIESNIYDATYFKIREITLGVDLGEFVKSDFIKGMEINAFVTNVFIWTKSDDLRHIDPENFAINGGTLVPGFEYTSLPPNRNYGFNLKLKF